MPIASDLIAAVVLLVAATWAFSREPRATIEVFTVTVSDAWALDHHCRAIRYIVTEAPELRRVEIDLGDYFVADRSTVSLLTSTRRRLEDVDVSLSIVAGPAVGRILIAGGLPASLRGAVDKPGPTRAMAN